MSATVTVLAATLTNGTPTLGGGTVENHAVIDGKVYFDIVKEGITWVQVSGNADDVLFTIPA